MDGIWFNLENGTALSPPAKEISGEAHYKWCRDHGIDAIGRMTTGRLDCLDIEMLKLNDQAWTNLSVDGLRQTLKDNELIQLTNIDSIPTVSLAGRSEKGITYGFRSQRQSEFTGVYYHTL